MRKPLVWFVLASAALMAGILLLVLATRGSNSPYAEQFLELFPEAHTYTSYRTGIYGPPTRQLAAALEDRYVLRMQVPVHLRATDRPEIMLLECESVSNTDSGQVFIKYGSSVSITVEEWQELVKASGDFKAIGIELKRGQPVPGFRFHWKHM